MGSRDTLKRTQELIEKALESELTMDEEKELRLLANRVSVDCNARIYEALYAKELEK